MFWKSKQKKKRKFLWPSTLEVNNLTKSASKYDLEDVIKIIVSYIYKCNNVKIAIINNDKLLDKLAPPDIELQALLSKQPFMYQLVIRENPKDDIIDIVCHEMIHLNQYQRGDLKLSDDMKTITWKGKQYDNSMPYFKRPWEIEAINNTRKIRKEMQKLYYE